MAERIGGSNNFVVASGPFVASCECCGGVGCCFCVYVPPLPNGVCAPQTTGQLDCITATGCCCGSVVLFSEALSITLKDWYHDVSPNFEEIENFTVTMTYSLSAVVDCKPDLANGFVNTWTVVSSGFLYTYDYYHYVNDFGDETESSSHDENTYFPFIASVDLRRDVCRPFGSGLMRHIKAMASTYSGIHDFYPQEPYYIGGGEGFGETWIQYMLPADDCTNTVTDGDRLLSWDIQADCFDADVTLYSERDIFGDDSWVKSNSTIYTSSVVIASGDAGCCP